MTSAKGKKHWYELFSKGMGVVSCYLWEKVPSQR